MPERDHHSPHQYGCPAVVYLLLTTAGHRGALMPFAWDTDLEALEQRAVHVAGVIVPLPVARCYLPRLEEWMI